MNYIIMFIVVVFPFLAQAEVNRSWDTLAQTVKVGKSVVVTRKNTSKAEGKLLAIDAESVTVKVHDSPERILREDVFRLRYANIRRRNTLIGLSAGFAIGFAIGASNKDLTTISSSSQGGLLIGAMACGIGAAAGGAIPIGKPLYEVQR